MESVQVTFTDDKEFVVINGILYKKYIPEGYMQSIQRSPFGFTIPPNPIALTNVGAANEG